MKIILLAAKSDNSVIGDGRDLLWHMPADLAFFQCHIRESILISGRKSMESPQGKEISHINPRIIVVSRQPDYSYPGGRVAHSIAEALDIARRQHGEKVYILGGGEIYRQAIELADELIITEIHHEFEGAARFPEIRPEVWEEASREDHSRDKENPYDYSFVVYRRKK